MDYFPVSDSSLGVFHVKVIAKKSCNTLYNLVYPNQIGKYLSSNIIFVAVYGIEPQ